MRIREAARNFIMELLSIETCVCAIVAYFAIFFLTTTGKLGFRWGLTLGAVALLGMTVRASFGVVDRRSSNEAVMTYICAEIVLNLCFIGIYVVALVVCGVV